AFIGINLVGGRVHDPAEWALRLPQDAAWINEVLTRPSMNDARAAVLLCQANPFVIKPGESKDKFKAFLVPFRKAAADWKKPLLFLHSDGHVWVDDQPWPEKNIRRIQVDKWDNKFPTIQVTVLDTGDAKTMFKFNRRLNDPQWKYQAPTKPAASGRSASADKPEKPVIVVLPFQNQTGDAAHDYWQQAAQSIALGTLGSIRALEVREFEAVAFGMEKVGCTAGSPISVAQARAIAQKLDADHVVWGSFHQANQGWQMELLLSPVSLTGEALHATISATNWLELLRTATDRLALELHQPLTPEKQAGLDWRWLRSNSALEWYAKALHAFRQGIKP